MLFYHGKSVCSQWGLCRSVYTPAWDFTSIDPCQTSRSDLIRTEASASWEESCRTASEELGTRERFACSPSEIFDRNTHFRKYSRLWRLPRKCDLAYVNIVITWYGKDQKHQSPNHRNSAFSKSPWLCYDADTKRHVSIPQWPWCARCHICHTRN